MPEEAKEESRDPYPYVSYGHKGTTASVNAYADIMQITRFLDSSRSGFFSVDLPQVLEPYFVQDRAQTLLDIRNRDGEGIYAVLDVEDDFPEMSSESKIEFIHNQWPLFTTEYDYITIKNQHVAFQDTIFQQYYWSTKKEPIIFPSGLKVSISAKFQIRDLDFTNPQYEFNEEDLQSENYTHHLSKSKHGFILKHTGLVLDEESEQQKEMFDSVALAVSIFVNGKAQELEQRDEDFYATKPGQKFTVDSSEPLQITVAYRLLLCEKDCDGDDFPITQDSLHCMHKMLRESSFTELKLSNDIHMNFVMQRNLEHILSVCSIPVPHKCGKGCQSQQPCPKEKEKAIALTCGDMSGHRIVTSASL